MDKALKQRLVGAIVLIALAVIVLPMILGGRPDGAGPEARSIELPAVPPDLDFETRRFPVGDDAGRSPAPSQQTESGRSAEPQDQVTITPLPEPRESSLAAASETVTSPENEIPEDEPDDEDVAPEAIEPTESMDTLVAELMDAPTQDNGQRYIVQVASFGSNDNAVRLARQLEDGGYDVLLDRVSSDTGELNRVRVGPYGSESEAREVVAALEAGISGVNPRVVDMQPEEAGPALASEDPLMRWVVQVGSFSSQDNAKDLVARLRTSGLSAFDETISTDTSTIHRVRVGPYLDRAEALLAEKRIADETGIDGVVMSSD